MNIRAHLLDIIDRSLSGPVVSEQDFDMLHVVKGVRSIVKKYDIRVTESERFLTNDQDLLDRVWAGAMEFLAECGVYCKDTGRVIQYSRQELEELVAAAPAELLMGEGRDQIRCVARKPDSVTPCLNLGGCVGIPVPNQYFEPIMISYLQEPLVDMTAVPTLEHFRGRQIRTKSPLEILAAYDEASRMKEIARRCGREGIHYHGISISVSDIGQLGAGRLMGKRDGMALGVISEFKVDNTILNKLTYGILYDQIIAAYANPIYGGLGGGLPGQILLLCAGAIMCSAILCSETPGTTPTHPMMFCSTTKELLQATNIAFSALARHSHIMPRLTGTQVGGCATKTLLYEVVTSAIVATKSGFAYLKGPRPATGAVPGTCSGLEARFQGEVLRAAAKLSPGKAEEIMGLAYDRYKDDMASKPFGKPFWEVYDVEKVKPLDHWLKIYYEVKDELISWGLPLEQTEH